MTNADVLPSNAVQADVEAALKRFIDHAIDIRSAVDLTGASRTTAAPTTHWPGAAWLAVLCPACSLPGFEVLCKALAMDICDHAQAPASRSTTALRSGTRATSPFPSISR